MHDDDDARLVERVLDGDAGAADALVRRYLRAAYATALAVTREPADAEDVAQDALVVALERLPDCRDPARFSAWLLRIVRNRALNHLRSRRLRDGLPLESASSVAGTGDPARDAGRAELRDRLRAGLETLTDKQREVVLLHDLEGWRHREIAQALGINEGTARYHLFHARRALRGHLGDDTPEDA